jgi:hypothetical protein
VQEITNPPQAPVIPPDWESKPGRNSGDSFNRYVYAENNPYRYVDPDGRQALPIPLPPPVIITGKRPQSDPFASPVQSSANKGDPVARKLVELWNKATAPTPSPPPEDEKDKQKKGRPEDNTKQNKQVEDAARDEKLNPQQRRELGRAVENESRGHGRNLDYHDIREIAKDIKNGKQ